MRYAIVDDNIDDIAIIKECILKHSQCKSDITSFNNSLNENIINQDHDVYFLDIDMPNIAGISLAEKIRLTQPYTIIIFITSQDHLVFDSFVVNPFYFVRKSRIESDLPNCLIKLEKYFDLTEKSIMIQTNKQTQEIKLNDIIYCEKFRNDLEFICINNEVIKARISLSALESIIDDSRFIRIHNSVLINLKYVQRIDQKEIYLSIGNHHFLISRLRYKSVKTSYLSYISGEQY